MVKLFFSLFLILGANLIGDEIPTPEYLPNKYDNSNFYDELTSMLFTLGLLVALLLAISWFVRRMQSTRQQYGNTGSRIKILEQRQISAKTIIYMLHINDKAMIIADSTNGVTNLSEFPFTLDPLDDLPPEPSLFNRVMQKK